MACRACGQGNLPRVLWRNRLDSAPFLSIAVTLTSSLTRVPHAFAAGGGATAAIHTPGTSRGNRRAAVICIRAHCWGNLQSRILLLLPGVTLLQLLVLQLLLVLPRPFHFSSRAETLFSTVARCLGVPYLLSFAKSIAGQTGFML